MVEIHNVQRFKDYCPDCKFLFSVRIYKQHNKKIDLDIYHQCDKEADTLGFEYNSFVFAYEDHKDGHYWSGINIRQLITDFCETRIT